MNTKSFFAAIGIIVLGSIAYVLYTTSKPLEPSGSLTNIDISPTGKESAISQTPKGNEAILMRRPDLEKLTYTLFEQNNSAVSGKVDLTEENGKIIVTVTLEDGKSGNYPAHFHAGTCENPGKILYPLTNVRKGTSQTVLTVSRETLQPQLPLVVNVHKSDREMNTSITCGVIMENTQSESE